MFFIAFYIKDYPPIHYTLNKKHNENFIPTFLVGYEEVK